MSIRDEIVRIANEQVGYKEYANNQTKYGQWYGLQGEWCDIFISWLANQVGILGTLIPKEAYVPTTANWYREKGLLKDKNYSPLKGDLILFDYNHNKTPDHIGIVDYVEGNVVHTIEGNKSKMVKRQQYAIGNSGIYGYAAVQYQEDSKKSIDEIAKEVLANKWGVYPERKELLEKAGYNYQVVQDRVNELWKKQYQSVPATANFVLGKYVVNTKKGLNVRSDPWIPSKGEKNNIIKTYPNGTRFDTYEIKGDWGRSPSGWCNLKYCKLVKKY